MIISETEFRNLLSTRKNIALILGCESLTALGIIRSLGMTNIPILGINFSQENSLPTYSKFAKIFYRPKSWTDQDLLDLLCSTTHKGAVLCATDNTEIFLNNNKNRLRHHWNFFYSNKYNSQDLMDKGKMLDWARAAGFSIPPTAIIEPGKNLPLKEIEVISPPCILKPATSLNFGKETFNILETKDNIIPIIENYRNQYGKCMLQEFVGDSTANGMIEVLAHKPSNSSRVLACGISKIRQYPYSIGSSSFIKTMPLSKEEHIKLAKYLTLIDYEGVVDFEFKKKGGQIYFLEINIRCGTPIHLSTCAGLNLVQIAYKHLIGEDINYDSVANPAVSIYWMRDDSDWKHLPEGHLGFWKFIKNLFQTDTYAIFKRNDLSPFIHYLYKSLRKKLTGKRNHTP